jgi:periplasmic protein TonB
VTEEVIQLRSNLARACLPVTRKRAAGRRRLEWANSLCALFLIVGLLGKQPLPAAPKPPPLPEQPVPIVLEPLTPPPATTEQKVEPQDQEQKQEAPQYVAVTINSPAINFSVPTIGNILVPIGAAPAPPPKELQQVVRAKAAPMNIASTGAGGDRPKPDYPEMAEKFGQQGSVELLITVNDVGEATDVTVKETSGFPILDHHAVTYVKHHWIVPPSNGGHVFLTRIDYQLKSQ